MTVATLRLARPCRHDPRRSSLGVPINGMHELIKWAMGAAADQAVADCCAVCGCITDGTGTPKVRTESGELGK